jgi:hypothetical protein
VHLRLPCLLAGRAAHPGRQRRSRPVGPLPRQPLPHRTPPQQAPAHALDAGDSFNPAPNPVLPAGVC